jgi:heparosan-N-sulfate-glucuronate 5-epimerase
MKYSGRHLVHTTVVYARLFRSWARMLAGRSYWHVEQGMGRQFQPHELAGYYNDLTAKAQWVGRTDTHGLPLNQFSKGLPVYFPTTLLQKALAHWDRWLASGRTGAADRAAFLKLADWALETQDERGGWSIWPLIGLCYASPYSAMTQGEGASVLTRAYSLTQDKKYLEGSRRALGPMLSDVSEGGTCRTTPGGLVLEEVPLSIPNTVLNGFVFALYGLHDYCLAAKPDTQAARAAKTALEASLEGLVAHIPKFDAGFWSYYDSRGSLASPFYHRLHIAQLRALELTFAQHRESFRSWRELFERYDASRLRRLRALVVKACQKLRHPPEVVLR